MEPTDSLEPQDRLAVIELAAAAEAADGTPPLNEEATLALMRDDALHWLARDGDAVVGYAQWQANNATGQLVVHPHHRRQRIGSSLLDGLRSRAKTRVWAFGTHAPARAFAAARGLAPVRGLTMMERVLADETAPAVPEGITLRGFTDADADAFLAVNAAAFVHHPEQGHFSAADLAARQAEDWWEPEGLILAVEGDEVLGFHWTKRHDATTGEVYVLGVDPRASGKGLGKVLLQAGLSRLADGGATRVILYVEADNEPALALYRRAGFEVVHTDTLYGPTTSS
ncbi:mycothiol synthase [Propioniciclava coleopterorum]|uniref:Mycothiol acetyltransferase n=1 Tax=Propioniciclava coleopterorum TaxID=2714937 RepID=A0A6G7Y4K0_9ACTN|nr:mycothiol synthase [Propioniciclava coleopterorum]QIK71745.1 mycothiol synthase [Propioniciclava coleopterorum]